MLTTPGIVIRTERTDSSCTTPMVQHRILTILVSYILPTEYRWYISLTNYTENVEGAIRSVPSGRMIYPDLQWEDYLDVTITECTTTDSTNR